MTALVRILKTPWLATIRSAYGYLMLAVWALLALNFSHALPFATTHAERLGIVLLLFAVATAWKMAVNALWLARDARALCLPGVGHDANAVPVIFAILTVLVPALVLGLVFGQPALWLVSLALVAAGVMAFCLLPTVVSLPVFLAALLYVVFIHSLPLPGAPGYLRWALPAFAILALASAQRWVVLMHAREIAESYWWRPANVGGRSVQLRRLRGGGHPLGVIRAFGGSRPEHRGESRGLRNVGPDHPVRSLRVALHRTLVPFDLRVDPAHYWRWRVVLAAAVLAPPVIALLAERHLGVAPVLVFSPQLLLFVAIVLTATSMHDRAAHEAWCSPRADLALVALLPGLVRPARAHRDTLIACTTGSLRVKAWCTYSAVMLFAVLHLPAMFYAYLALTLLTGVAMQFATTTGALCGRRWHRITGYVMYAAVLTVAAIPTTNWGVRIDDAAHPRLETLGWPAVACVALWLACCAAFGTLAWCNWRRFAARPHPFLANRSGR